jgi:hypothetical protein
MLIAKDIAQELTYGNECEGFKIIEDKIVDHSRWSIIYKIVVEKDGKFYASSYSNGATESQDESPYDDEGDQVEFREVQKKEVLVTVYE